eukprot:Protomagalhaensia_sp_Gyna_25__5343@NODE_677_length_2853_cov_189_941720_g528_i0_p2_GENE_NODE_677_length_2853_cov_189_941720_g528_i0NODE_677_length_2853_cov_189_941720_g528_i0_p2_ORF_typecomplete_len221_score33_79_NODE_677_length_2853_cov_189_941720_g528_i0204866
MRVPLAYTLVLVAVTGQEAACPEACVNPATAADIVACASALQVAGAGAGCTNLTFNINVPVPGQTTISSCNYPSGTTYDHFAVMRDLALLPDCTAIIDLGGDFAENARVGVTTTCSEIRSGTPPANADPASCNTGPLDNLSNVLQDGSVPVKPAGAWLQGATTGTSEAVCSLRSVTLSGTIPMTVTLTATPPAPEPEPEGVTATTVLSLGAAASALAFMY